jgi:hypothetical protein
VAKEQEIDLAGQARSARQDDESLLVANYLNAEK